MNLIEIANLPTKKVNTVLISGEFANLIKELNNLNVKTITTSACKNLPIGEQYHADMQVIHIDNKLIVLKECVELVEQIEKYNILYSKTDSKISNKYPKNVILNSVILKDYAILNTKTAHKEITDDCEKNNKIIVNVKQGYTKCSTAIISDNAIITADNGIFSECKKYKIDVLKISEGNISLPKFNFGFIGGCCGLIDKSTIVFTGDIKKHPDYNDIYAFCRNYKIDVVSLSNDKLLDIGGIIPLSYE